MLQFWPFQRAAGSPTAIHSVEDVQESPDRLPPCSVTLRLGITVHVGCDAETCPTAEMPTRAAATTAIAAVFMRPPTSGTPYSSYAHHCEYTQLYANLHASPAHAEDPVPNCESVSLAAFHPAAFATNAIQQTGPSRRLPSADRDRGRLQCTLVNALDKGWQNPNGTGTARSRRPRTQTSGRGCSRSANALDAPS